MRAWPGWPPVPTASGKHYNIVTSSRFQNTLVLANPLLYVGLEPTARLLLCKAPHLQPHDVGHAPQVGASAWLQNVLGLVLLPCLLLTPFEAVLCPLASTTLSPLEKCRGTLSAQFTLPPLVNSLHYIKLVTQHSSHPRASNRPRIL